MKYALLFLILFTVPSCVGRHREPSTTSAKVGMTYSGKVCFYHDSLAGNHTANGEIYSLSKLTAASRTLPFGTKVRVTRIDNGKSVVVRVNDRGPFNDHSRVLDLSKAAAKKLDMMKVGVVSARVEILHIPR